MRKKFRTSKLDLAQTTHPFLKITSKMDSEEGGEDFGPKNFKKK